jgi:hypothetical protein
MTNRLRELCRAQGLGVLEGPETNRFDALIQHYCAKQDLLIEVKASSDRACLRLAVGQLLDYRRKLDRAGATDVAVLLPNKPLRDDLHFLRYLGVKALWFERNCTLIAGDWRLRVKPQQA